MRNSQQLVDAPVGHADTDSLDNYGGPVTTDEAAPALEDSAPMQLVRTLVRAAGDLATFCDRSEHNESADRDSVLRVGHLLRVASVRSGRKHTLDIQSLYSDRIERIEAKHPARHANAFDGAQGIREAKTWEDLQSAQYMHDLFYHADVAGLAKSDQLRHYTLHIAKLAKLALDAADEADRHPGSWDHFLTERLPDIVIFGIKLATVCGTKLAPELVSLPTIGGLTADSRRDL